MDEDFMKKYWKLSVICSKNLANSQFSFTPCPVSTRRIYDVVVSSQFRRSFVADTSKCYIHVTSQDDKPTTKLRRRSFVIDSSKLRTKFVIFDQSTTSQRRRSFFEIYS